MHPSSSDRTDAYHRLHPEIQRWIREEGWTELREVQERSVHAILDGRGDVLVSASTAAGKTEAAFLPILTAIAERKAPGLSAIYVSPLKALINDQYRRLEDLADRMEIPVVRWHGDAPQGAKQQTVKNPRGIALITPESIEALFVRRPAVAKKLLGNLDFVLIDELHAFLKGPRGLQLHSLLRRIDAISPKRARRVALSATLGDAGLAAEWLEPQDPSSVVLVESLTGAPELRMQVRAVIEPDEVDDPDGLEEDGGQPRALDIIADHAFETLRGDNNLLFAGSRRRVEALADRLRTRCEKAGVPNEFFPHHGSLSKELREELELRLKRAELPTTAIATTTLELGVDIGSVKSVAQVGAPRSLASLRQRLGRSGRRKGIPAILRIYVRERTLSHDADPLDRLRLEVVRAVASVRLLVAKFVEPPEPDASVATVVLHQTLSIIAERGGQNAAKLYQAVCGPGPLASFTKQDYLDLLRFMVSPETKLLEQAPDGTIMLGEVGERVTSARDFYAVFASDDEWKLVTGGRALGTIPPSNAVVVGTLLAFAGRRWRITAVDDTAKVLEVEFHPSGKLPKFESLGYEVLHDRLTAEMREVLRAADMPGYLDANAVPLLEEGRSTYRRLGLDTERFVAAGEDTHVFLWRGTALSTLVGVVLNAKGFQNTVHDLGVTVAKVSPDEIRAILRKMAPEAAMTATEMSAYVHSLRVAKFDDMVPEPLLRRLWARRHERFEEPLSTLLAELTVDNSR